MIVVSFEASYQSSGRNWGILFSPLGQLRVLARIDDGIDVVQSLTTLDDAEAFGSMDAEAEEVEEFDFQVVGHSSAVKSPFLISRGENCRSGRSRLA